jgi:2',3'-cyclic-nucleotide 2'-phosphodiesterase/3'-nucleotidase/5'-nucleotidase
MTNARSVRRTVLMTVLTGAFGVTGSVADPDKDISLVPLGSYASGIFINSGSEIAAFDKGTATLFITNVAQKRIDVVNISNPSTPLLVRSLALAPYSPNSVAIDHGLVAVAAEASPKTDPGKVFFFDAEGTLLSSVTVGSLPDMITFTPDGKRVLVANEGEPNNYLAGNINPEGSVSIIEVGQHPETLTDADVVTAGLTAFNSAVLDPSIRIFGPGATVAQDLEPEYITVSHDSTTAWVTLQEANAIGVLDIPNGQFTRLIGLGFKDHSLPGAALDGSDRDGPSNTPKINIANWPVLGMYQPDAIASYRVEGHTYLVTANEGDSRSAADFPGFDEEARVSTLTLDASLPAALKTNAQIGRLTVSTVGADVDHDGDVDRLYAFGARSFSIWTDDGTQVFDSGDAFEQITAAALPLQFNSNNDANNSFDTRSDNKGPEPEGVAVEKVYGRWYAFVTLERIGGVIVYDITDPRHARFVQYINTRNFSGSPAAGTAGDLGPEGVLVIPASDSPIQQPLLVLSNEISGTTRVFAIAKVK